MLGVEKRVDAMRQMQGDTRTEAHGPAKSAANTAITLALVAIVAAAGVYFVLEGKYSAKLSAYETRMAGMDARVAEAMNAPKDMARKLIVANALSEVSNKVDTLKGQLDASYQERLAKVDDLLKSMLQDVSK